MPYRGSVACMTDLIGGHVILAFDALTTYTPHVTSGELRVFAAAGDARLPTIPDVPTTAEAGVAELRVPIVGGLWAPSATPLAVIDKLNEQMREIMLASEVRDKLPELGVDPSSSTPSEMRQKVQAEVDYYAPGAKLTGYQAE